MKKLFLVLAGFICVFCLVQNTLGVRMPLSLQAQDVTPAVYEEFAPWEGNISPDGIWRIAGIWNGSGGELLPENTKLLPSYQGDSGGFLLLTQTKVGPDGAESDAEIQSLTSYGYGYYEVRMKVTDVPGVCASFFTIQASGSAPDFGYGPLEFDVEFLTGEPWIHSPDSGAVHFQVHPCEKNLHYRLPFNPSRGFHRYGLLWQTGRLDQTVDGVIVNTVKDSTLVSDAKNFIMMNTYSDGNPYWSAGPPPEDATTVYDWVKFYPNVTSVPQ